MTPLRTFTLFLAGALLLLFAWRSTTSTRTIFEESSAFGRVTVVERPDGLRQLRTGERGVLQTQLYPDQPWHLVSGYTRVGMIGLALVPEDARILYVGLGGGAMPTFTRHALPAAQIDVVEIDPVIIAVARTFFGFSPDYRMAVHAADGRAFIEAAPAGYYDLIVLDAFAEHAVPFALATQEFLASVRSRLAPNGVAVANLWTAAPDYEGMLATWDATFEYVALLRVPRRRQRILVAAANRPLTRDALAHHADALADRIALGFDLPALVRRGYEGPPDPHAAVLRDADRR